MEASRELACLLVLNALDDAIERLTECRTYLEKNMVKLKECNGKDSRPDS